VERYDDGPAYLGPTTFCRVPLLTSTDQLDEVRPDVAIIHAQEADRGGNVQLWGIPGVQKEAILGSQRSIVTVERIVDRLEPRPGGVVIPGWVIDAVAEVPGGSHPSYSLGITTRDNDFYRFWDELSRDRERFAAWMNEHVLEVAAP